LRRLLTVKPFGGTVIPTFRRIKVGCSAVALFIAAGLPGCQYRYPVEVRGSVRSSADGSSLRGVLVKLWESVEPVYSEADGTFKFEFQDDWVAGDAWELSLSRGDFNDELVTMKLSHGPDTKGTTQIFVFVYMRPKG